MMYSKVFVFQGYILIHFGHEVTSLDAETQKMFSEFKNHLMK